MFKSKSSRADKAAKQQPQPVFKQDYFDSCHRTYSCIHCRAHLANHDELISKLFQGNHGRAYLFNKVVNIGCKQAVERELLTGLHAVADIYCDSCETTLGWKYEQAFVPSQKYKEGKYIIELVHMLKENNWDLTSYNVNELLEEESNASNESTEVSMRDNFRFGDAQLGSSTGSQITSEKSNNNVIQESEQASQDTMTEPEAGELVTDKLESESDVRLTVESPPKDEVEYLSQTNKQVPPFSLVNRHNTEGNQTRIDMSNELELIERSLNRLQLDAHCNNLHYRNTSTSTATQRLSTSSKNSLCSSRSPSDSSSSASVIDGDSTNDEILETLD